MTSALQSLISGFESLNNDTLNIVLEFVGKSSYSVFGKLTKRSHEVYLSSGWPKETFLCGYAPLSIFEERYIRPSNESVGKAVVYYNRGDLLNWAIREKNKEMLWEICVIATKAGITSVLGEVLNSSALRKKKKFFDYLDLDIVAADKGHLNLLKWLDTNKLSINKEECVQYAATKDHVKILEWFLDSGYEFDKDKDVFWYAADGGNLVTCKWLLEQGCSWDGSTFPIAARAGNIQLLQWLLEQGCPWDERTFKCAAQVGKMQVLEWLREQGCPWDGRCYSNAACNGHSEVLYWLKYHDCPVDFHNFNLPLSEEDIDPYVEEWARENDIGINYDV